MRSVDAFLVVAAAAALLGGCANPIPVRRDVGVSALEKKGEIPPEFAALNNFDPRVNALLAEQLCATPYRVLEQKTMPMEPGALIAWRIACEPYRLPLSDLSAPVFASVP
jgi:hypothetical protein